jgi:chromosome segregation ATPase
VARREAVNQEQQQRQQEGQGLVSGYPSRATGLAVLAGPLAVWEGFTSLASHLPGSAGDTFVQMNTEAQRMQQSFDQMAAGMVGADQAQPAQAAALQGDAGRLEQTGTESKSSEVELRSAQAGAQGLQRSNAAAGNEAQQLQGAAEQRQQDLADAAAQEEEHATTLAEQMTTWAQNHRAARQQAIDATMERLRSQGMTNVRAGTDA